MRSAAMMAVALAFCSEAAAQTPCADLLGQRVAGRGTITLAERVAGPSFTPPPTINAPNPTPIVGLPPLCRVAATLRPTGESDIRIEVWLPEGAAYNGRLNGTGNGGFNGAISYASLAGGVRFGFATANTDQGTAPSTTTDARPIVGFTQKQIDFGRRATHLMTRAAKQVIEAHYGAAPAFSYFTGCSNGGQQGYQEAQRYPEDYNGILAGAPANNRAGLGNSTTWIYRTLRDDPPSSYITPPTARLITQAALAACVGRDGGLSTDRWLTDPRQCRWNPASIQCAPGTTDTSQCLTPDQVRAANRLYGGPRNPRTNERLYVGVPRTSESGHSLDWPVLGGIFGPQPTPEPLFNGQLQWVFGRDFTVADYDFDGDARQVDRALASFLNANNPDLSAFRARGGKLLSYHGWIDVLVPAADNVNYYLRAVQAQDGAADPRELPGGADAIDPAALARTQEFFRLFMVPGMGHCGSGPGPQFPLPSVATAADPERNPLLALQRWVEQGVAPERFIGTTIPVAGAPQQSRPLCPFPAIAQYDGTGDPTVAGSYRCVPGRVGPNQDVSANHLR